jgi:hypothetical protein
VPYLPAVVAFGSAGREGFVSVKPSSLEALRLGTEAQKVPVDEKAMVRRAQRKHDVRARTESTKRLPIRDLRLGAALYPEDTRALRPVVRAECGDFDRPCPFVSCKHHLFLDVSPQTGAIKFNFPDLEPDELAETCALDVADAGGVNLERAGALLNVTRERIRQIETRALAKLERSTERSSLADYAPERGPGRRRLPILEAST